jgi:hypothetical protein
MAYDDSNDNYARVGHFSNPDVLHDGQPTGVPIGDLNQAHNAAAINAQPWVYEAFRITRYDVWVDFAAPPGGIGTYQLPYNTVAGGASEAIHGEGASDLPNLWIKSGTTTEMLTISRPMRVRSCGGSVRIGNTP